jgi:arabinogalactan oligomer/maltooligosaccharide transport system permease protein
MVAWSGWRKAVTVLLFIGPTMLGILLFSIYPILLSTYTSFTNRNKFRPNPDCDVALNGIFDPLCWPVFRDRVPTGLGNPYRIADPLFANYEKIIGSLFTVEALLAVLMIVVVFTPLIIAWQVNKRFDALASPPLSSGVVWLLGLLGGLVLAWALNLGEAYGRLLETGDFVIVVMRTLIFVVVRVPFSFLLGLIFALILNSEHLPGRTAFRIALFVPWAASSLGILMALIWQFFFREQGTINQVLEAFGFGTRAWLSDPFTAFAAVVLVDVWFSYPFFMIVILGALQAVPNDVYEAAELDGASYWQQLTRITLPLIRPAVLPATVLTSITAFQMFGTVWAITGGGPIQQVGKPGATEFVIVYAFKQIFQTQNYGTATAFAVILFFFLFAATLWSLRLTQITKGAYES